MIVSDQCVIPAVVIYSPDPVMKLDRKVVLRRVNILHQCQPLRPNTKTLQTNVPAMNNSNITEGRKPAQK
jgi:hypothetical protein